MTGTGELNKNRIAPLSLLERKALKTMNPFDSPLCCHTMGARGFIVLLHQTCGTDGDLLQWAAPGLFLRTDPLQRSPVREKASPAGFFTSSKRYVPGP